MKKIANFIRAGRSYDSLSLLFFKCGIGASAYVLCQRLHKSVFHISRRHQKRTPCTHHLSSILFWFIFLPLRGWWSPASSATCVYAAYDLRHGSDQNTLNDNFCRGRFPASFPTSQVGDWTPPMNGLEYLASESRQSLALTS